MAPTSALFAVLAALILMLITLPQWVEACEVEQACFGKYWLCTYLGPVQLVMGVSKLLEIMINCLTVSLIARSGVTSNVFISKPDSIMLYMSSLSQLWSVCFFPSLLSFKLRHIHLKDPSIYTDGVHKNTRTNKQTCCFLVCFERKMFGTTTACVADTRVSWAVGLNQ